jgi:hypothetical protein
MLSDDHPANDELAGTFDEARLESHLDDAALKAAFDDALITPLDADFLARWEEDHTSQLERILEGLSEPLDVSLLDPLADWVDKPLDASLLKRLGEDRPGSSAATTIAAGDAGSGSHL